MFLQPWSPFRELRRFNRVANQQWRGYPRYAVETPEPEYWSLAVDVVEADDALRVNVTGQQFSWTFEYPDLVDAEGKPLTTFGLPGEPGRYIRLGSRGGPR